jgi:hypothetical protein
MLRYLQFECGARLPETGGLEKPFHEMAKDWDGKPNADGRYRLCIFSTTGRPDQPVLPDGEAAPCLLGCPVPTKKSGRKSVKAPSLGTSEGFDYYVSCLPTEVVVPWQTWKSKEAKIGGPSQSPLINNFSCSLHFKGTITMSLNLSYNELTLIHDLVSTEQTKIHNLLGETDISETKATRYSLRYGTLTSLQKTLRKSIDEQMPL